MHENDIDHIIKKLRGLKAIFLTSFQMLEVEVGPGFAAECMPLHRSFALPA